MERLTVKCETSEHYVHHKCVGCELYPSGCADCEYETEAVDQLASYEDSVLSPVRVMELAKAQEEGRVVEIPDWPVVINKTIGRYMIVGANSGNHTITLLDVTRALDVSRTKVEDAIVEWINGEVKPDA